MIDVAILGGSGYIGTNLRETSNQIRTENKYTFYSKSGTKNGLVKYKNTNEVGTHDIIIDLSQSASRKDIYGDGELIDEYKRIRCVASKCSSYIMASTAGINLNNTLDKENNNYIKNKQAIEKWMKLELYNGMTIRFPVVFGNSPKSSTIIKKLVNTGLGKKEKYENPSAMITAIYIIDLFNTIEKITSRINNGVYTGRPILISERKVYGLNVIRKGLRANVSKEKLLEDVKMMTVDINTNDCEPLVIADLAFYDRIMEIIKTKNGLYNSRSRSES